MATSAYQTTRPYSRLDSWEDYYHLYSHHWDLLSHVLDLQGHEATHTPLMNCSPCCHLAYGMGESVPPPLDSATASSLRRSGTLLPPQHSTGLFKTLPNTHPWMFTQPVDDHCTPAHYKYTSALYLCIYCTLLVVLCTMLLYYCAIVPKKHYHPVYTSYSI